MRHQRVSGSVGVPFMPTELTAREREVARLIALGSLTKQIAYELDISVKTVETHRAAIRQKLGGISSVGVVLWAVRTGLVKVSD